MYKMAKVLVHSFFDRQREGRCKTAEYSRGLPKIRCSFFWFKFPGPGGAVWLASGDADADAGTSSIVSRVVETQLIL